jgi:ABC-type glycerol-3-phosphate transport system substrate-binding protein
MDAASSTGSVYFNKAPAAGLDWDFMPLPKGPGGYGGRISTDGYMIDKNTKYGDQAWTVLKELTSAETSVVRGTIQRQQPPRRSALSSFEKGFEGKTARLARLMGETGRPDPRAFWKDAVQVEALLKKYLDASIGRNEMALAPAMAAAMQEIRGYYGA